MRAICDCIYLRSCEEINTLTHFVTKTGEAAENNCLDRFYSHWRENAPHRVKPRLEENRHTEINDLEYIPGQTREKHLAIWLARDIGHVGFGDNGQILRFLDFEMPLKNVGTDEIAGTRLGDVDIVGYTDDNIIWVIELKIKRNGQPDTPLYALIEGLSYCAVLANSINRYKLCAEFRQGHDVGNQNEPEVFDIPAIQLGLMVLAEQRYWDYWNDQIERHGEWRGPIHELTVQIADSFGHPVLLGSLSEDGQTISPVDLTVPGTI